MPKIIFLFLSVIYCVFGLELPSDFQICKRTDPKINECLRNAIQDSLPKLQNGLPDFNFPKIQPLEVPRVSIGEGKGAVHVVQNFKNAKLYNIPFAKVERVNVNFNDTLASLDIDAYLDEVKIDAEYDLNGRILVLPIIGSGAASIRFQNIKIQIKAILKEFKKNDKSYLDVDHLKVDLQPSKIVFRFDNLFNGDERLGNEMNTILNDNWKEIWEDVADSYKETLAIIIQDIAKKIFKTIPHEKLFPF